MPEGIPKFDPNKPYNEVQTSAPKFDPSKPYKPIVQEDIIKEGFTPGDVTGGDDELEKRLDFIQKDSKRTMRDDEKDILRDMYKNPNATKADLTDAILTFQGKKLKQVDNTITTPAYYMDKDARGIYKPIALRVGEKAPKDKETSSIWGTQKSANDDALYTDVAKTAFNIIPGVIGGVVDLAQLGTQLITGEESDALRATQQSIENLKFKKDEDISGSLYDIKDINSFTDLFDSKRLDLSPKTIWGTALSAAGFMGEMLVPAGFVAKGAKAYKAGRLGLEAVKDGVQLSKIGQKASVFAGSFMTQIGDVMDSSSEAGLDGRSKALYDLTIGSALALVDAKYDVAGKILMNKLSQDAKKEILSGVGKKIVKDEFGNITKQSLNDVTKEAMTAYTPIVSGFAKTAGKDILDEVKDETLQSFLEKAGQQLYDKISPDDKAKFGTDAFGAKSFGEYINSALSGLVGAGAPSIISAKGKQKADYEAQSNSAYEAVKDGDEGVKALKTNITNAFEKGEINQQDYDNAMFKVNAYDSYHKVSSDLSLDDANKKKLFELSLQKENLKASIKEAEAKDTEGHSRLDKMTPPELGLHNAKVKQAKALQDDIDLIVAKSEVMQQPEVSESVIDKVVKEEEKAAAGPKGRVKGEPKSEIGELLGRYGQIKVKESKLEEMVPNGQKYTPPKKVVDETRTMKDISPDEWNASDFDVTIKQHKFADALDAAPEKTVGGTLQEDNKFIDNKGREVQTFNITLPNGKSVRFASSMVRHPEENALGGFRGNTYEENLTNKENPIGQKVGATVRTLKDSGRKVIFIWNAEEGPKFGKHVGMVKESMRGNSNYSEADLDEMADLRMLNMGENPNAPAPGIINPEGPINEGPVKEKPTKKSPKKSNPSSVTRDVRQELLGLKYTKADIQNMTVKEAYDIANEKRSKVAKQESKEVEISDKKKIAEYRSKEQEDLIEAGINLEDYPGTYGNEQGNMPDDLYAKYKPIYNKYNKLITEASESKPAEKDSSKGDLRNVEIKEKKSNTDAKDNTSETKDDVNNAPIMKSKASGNKTLYTPRKVLELAYANDKMNNPDVGGAGQTLENIIRRGGYAIEELDALIPGWRTMSLEYRSTKKDTGIGSKNYKENKNQFTGRSSSKVLPSGEKIKGKYKLVEAKDVLASHNEKNFGQTENFPKREDGSTLNDRDYERDKNAQKEVVRIANEFDSRALDNIPTVTNDGIVVDGNNRTMSRKLAAENNTDAEYKESLKEQADMYGFTEEQVNSLKNPFLVFEMEGNVEYSTKLFSEFNKSEKKEKSPIDKAIQVSKTIDERSKRLISDLYSDVSTPSEVTSNPVKVRQAIKILQDLGILQPNELPRYFDITKSTTTKDGVSLLESIVLGSTLTESALRSLDVEGMGKVRTQLLSSIAQLTKNSTLGKNSLVNEISTVVDLINSLKSLDLSLDQYVNQPDLFGDKQKVNINEYAVATALSESGFKKWLQDYNNRVGQMDLFKGEVVTKNEILEETIQKNTGKPASSIFGVEKLQKVKPKAETISKFKQSVDLFYKAKDTDGASKRRAILEQRREFLEKNPSFKYIDDNMKYIYKELEQKGIIERFGECP